MVTGISRNIFAGIAVFCLALLVAAEATAGVNVWSTGGQNIESVQALTSVGSTTYAGTPSGVYKSTDGGQTWSNTFTVTSFPSGYGKDVHALTVYGTTIYAATWGDSGGFAGVFKSVDGGLNWNVIAPLTNPGEFLVVNPFSLAVVATTPDPTIYAGFDDDVYSCVLNGTDEWAMTNLFNLANTLAADPDGSSNPILWAGTLNGIQYFDGSVWLNSTFPSSLNVNSLTINPLTTPSMLFAGTDSGIYRSTNGGGTWTASGLSGSVQYAMALNAVSPAYSDLFVGAFDNVQPIQFNGVFWSNDNAAVWTPYTTGLPVSAQIRSLHYDSLSPASIYAGLYDGLVYRMTLSSLLVSSNQVNFGPTLINTTSAEIVTLANIGTKTITVNSITATGAFTPQALGCPSLTPTLPAGASCMILVEFTPTSLGNHSANLTITSSDTSGALPDQSIPLSGIGVDSLVPYSVKLSNTGGYYTTITDAYPVAVNSAEISVLNSYTQAPGLDLNRSVTSVTIKGGYKNGSYNEILGTSTIAGPVTVSAGSVIFENIVIN